MGIAIAWLSSRTGVPEGKIREAIEYVINKYDGVITELEAFLIVSEILGVTVKVGGGEEGGRIG